jgi:hypothetical protein
MQRSSRSLSGGGLTDRGWVDIAGTRAPRLRLATSLAFALAALLALSLAPSALAATPPTQTVNPPTEVAYTTAHVSGTVNPNGGGVAFQVYFEFKEPSAESLGFVFAGEVTAAQAAGSTPIPFTAELTSLHPGAEYEVRLTTVFEGAERFSPEPNPKFTTEAVAKPTVAIDPVTTFTANTAHFSGHVNPNAPAAPLSPAAAAAYKVSWHFVCTPECPGLQGGEIAADNSSHEVAADATGLKAAQAYQVVLVAENAAGEVTAGPEPFTTPAGPPAVEATSSSGLTRTCATLESVVNPNASPTEVSFEYGTSLGYGSQTPPTAIGTSNEPHATTTEVCGLTLGTEYHFRTVAENPLGTVRGADQTFTTVPALSIDATSASQVTATSARLEAELNPRELPTTFRFEFDTAPYTEGGPAHGTGTPAAAAGAGNSDVAVATLVQGLAPGTVYHYRVVAENALGTVTGPDLSFTTQGSVSASLLPDGRAWELVSPPDKGGIPLESIAYEGSDIQAAADGSALTYIATGAVGSGVAGNRSLAYSQLLSTRGSAGWSTADVTPPNEGASVGLTVGRQGEYGLFSSDLTQGLVESAGATPLSPDATERTLYIRRSDGSFIPLVTDANVPPDTKFGGVEEAPARFNGGLYFEGATPDLSHVVFQSSVSLTAGFTSNSNTNLYEWTAGALDLVGTVPAGGEAVCGGAGPACIPTGETGLRVDLGFSGEIVRNAVSSAGSRVVFETTRGSEGSGNALWLRDLPRGETLHLDAVQGGSGGNAHPVYLDASPDGSRIFFTDEAALTPDSGAEEVKPDLYMCQVEVTGGHLACALSDLSVDSHPGEAADVQRNVLGTDEGGDTVYFVANGMLTEGEGAVAGNCTATEGGFASAGLSCNLYQENTATRTIRLVAVVSNRDSIDWLGGATQSKLTNVTSRVSPDGHWLAFMSERPLTGYDNRDAVSGRRDQEVFLYDAATGTLTCASCNPSGARPRGLAESGKIPGPLVDRPTTLTQQAVAASVPGYTGYRSSTAVYQSRYLSDSGRLFFNAADALVPQDTNGTEDVYEFEPPGVGDCTTASSSFGQGSGGCVGLISSGTSGEESAFLDASESGDDVFFLTASKLVPQDTDVALDAYDAHVCSAASPCPPAPPPAPPICSGDACQLPATPPNDATPGSLTFNGAGNVLECPKGKVKQKGKCVTKKSKKKQNKKHKKSSKQKSRKQKKSQRAAGHNRGGHK